VLPKSVAHITGQQKSEMMLQAATLSLNWQLLAATFVLKKSVKFAVISTSQRIQVYGHILRIVLSSFYRRRFHVLF